MQHFIGRRGWRIEFPELSRTYTHLDPGPVKGEIVLEHNSVGAFTGGTLTVEGYLDWVPYSSGVRVYVGPDPDPENRVGLGVLGKPDSTISATGQRTTTLPLLSYSDVLDGGFIEEPVPTYDDTVPAINGEVAENVVYGVPDDRLTKKYAETRGEYYRRMLGDSPLGAWGVRPDGGFAVGIPGSEPGAHRLTLDTRDPAWVALPSNYETGDYLSGYMVRPGERWEPRTVTRPDLGPYVPQRVQALTTDTILEDVTQAWGPLTQVELPVTDFRTLPSNGPGATGVWGAFSLDALLSRSAGNLDATDAVREVVAVTADVAVDVDTTLPPVPPADWRPVTNFALDYWAQVELKEARSDLFPVGRDRTAAEQSEFDQNRQIWFDFARGTDPASNQILSIGFFIRRRAEAARQAMWDAQLAGDVVRLSYAEWLSTSGEIEPATVTRATPEATLQAENRFIQEYAARSKGLAPLGRTSTAGMTAVELLGWYGQIGREAHADAPDPVVTRVALTPEEGTVLEMGARTNTVMDPDERRSFRWRFSLPENLLKRSSKDTAYLNAFWAFAVTAWSRVPGVDVTVMSATLTVYSREPNRPLDEAKEVPGMARSPVSPQTWQGHAEGHLFYGPALLTLPDGSRQYAAQTRMVIAPASQRTEFQTGARQG